jgi:hypothetical protein
MKRPMRCLEEITTILIPEFLPARIAVDNNKYEALLSLIKK